MKISNKFMRMKSISGREPTETSSGQRFVLGASIEGEEPGPDQVACETYVPGHGRVDIRTQDGESISVIDCLITVKRDLVAGMLTATVRPRNLMASATMLALIDVVGEDVSVSFVLPPPTKQMFDPEHEDEETEVSPAIVADAVGIAEKVAVELKDRGFSSGGKDADGVPVINYSEPKTKRRKRRVKV